MDGIGIILLGQGGTLRTGDPATRTHRVVDMPVGPALLGRVVDATGRPLDRDEPIAAEARWPTRSGPADHGARPGRRALADRHQGRRCRHPDGRGQRELILGDRQTGKTTIALDAIINQRRPAISIYCANRPAWCRRGAGRGGAEGARCAGALRVVVVAAGDDPAGLQFVVSTRRRPSPSTSWSRARTSSSSTTT
ncbi:MAG: hypothetical protein R3D25_15930 [Geminicoccaceae bacterium]